MRFLQLEGLGRGGGVLFQKWPTLDPDTLPPRARAISLEEERERDGISLPKFISSDYSIIISILLTTIELEEELYEVFCFIRIVKNN